MIRSKKYLLFSIFNLLLIGICAGQLVSNVLTFDSTNSKFTSIENDGSGAFYFSGYVRPFVSGTSDFGNLSYQGYWYEDGLSCKAQNSGQLDWMTVSGNSNGLEDCRQIKHSGTSVYSCGKFVSSSSSLFVNSVNHTYPYGCCHGGYVLKQTDLGGFEWIFPLDAYALDLDVDNQGNVFVVSENSLKKISPLGTELWNVDLTSVNDAKILLRDDTVYISAMFQSFLIIGGTPLEPLGAANDVDVFFARFSDSGSFISVTQIGSPGTDLFHDIAFDSNNNLWISGECPDSAYFGGQSICGSGNRIYFLQLNSALQIQRCEVVHVDSLIHFPVISGEMLFNLSNERIAVMNVSNDLIIQNDTIHINIGGGYEGTSILVKWDNSGAIVWARPLAMSLTQTTNAAWVSAHLLKNVNQEIYLAGQMREACMIDGINYNPGNYYCAYFAELHDTTVVNSVFYPQNSILVRCTNPVTSRARIFFDREFSGDCRIFNSSGFLVFHGRLNHSRELFVPTETWESGVYIIQNTDGVTSVYSKLIKM